MRHIKKLYNDKNLRAVIFAFFIQIIGALLGFLLQITITKNVNVETYGEFSIIFNYLTLFVHVVVFGTNIYVLKSISIFKNVDLFKLRKTYSTTIFFLIINWVVASFVIILAIYFFKEIDLNYKQLLPIIFWLLFFSLTQVMQNVDRGLGKVSRSMWPNTILKSLLLIAIILGLNQVNFTITVDLLIWIYTLVFFIITSFYLSYHYNSVLRIKKIKYSFKEYVKTFNNSKHYFVNTIAQNTLKSLDLIIIGFYLTSFDAGIYSVAIKINLVVFFSISSLNIVFSPHVAKLYKEKKINELNQKLRNANFSIFFFGLITVLSILLYGESILYAFGPEYIEARLILILLSLGTLIETVFGMTGSILNMTNNQFYFNKLLFILIIIYIILSKFFIINFGLNGLAVLLLIITLFKNIFQWHFIYFKLEIKTGVISYFYAKVTK